MTEISNRRHFLKTSSLIVGASAAPFIRAQSKSGKKYKTALIGSGWWGMNILRVAIEDGSCDVVALCDVDSDELEVSADEVEGLTGKIPNMYRDYREMLEKEDIEIAIISTPDHWHALQAIACVEAGAHVFVEKPFGTDDRECELLCDLAKRKSLIIVVGHVFLFNSSIITLKKIIENGDLGKILHIEAHRTNLGPVRKDVNSQCLDMYMFPLW